ncbi:MAG: hypothetical protein QGE94_05065 [Desulfobacterales bacterium]|jgi:hypothetical protein|nr:hypothetical protein [Desulfobacterales bacterium]|tara:strand:+ start:152 stop:424 length:273 start_codon:yes stop_codon:yes gene_type:complete
MGRRNHGQRYSVAACNSGGTHLKHTEEDSWIVRHVGQKYCDPVAFFDALLEEKIGDLVGTISDLRESSSDPTSYSVDRIAVPVSCSIDTP